MTRVHFETNPTDESAEYAELVELVLVLLNRVVVELTLESQRNKNLTQDQFRVAGRLIHSACGVGTLIPDLIKEQSLRLPYAFPLARMCYERLLSAAYVLSDEGSTARRAILYSAYRVFKHQVRTLSLGGQTTVIKGQKGISRKSPVVAEALEYFKNAKSVVEYEHTRDQRRTIVSTKSKKAGIQFKAVEQMGFSTSSEVAHGSYYSTIMYSEVPDASTPAKGFDEATTIIMSILVLSSEALGHLLVKIFPDLPSPPLLVEAGKTFMKFEVPEAIDLINQAYGKKSRPGTPD